jgi:hypothetical protein
MIHRSPRHRRLLHPNQPLGLRCSRMLLHTPRVRPRMLQICVQLVGQNYLFLLGPHVGQLQILVKALANIHFP